ncbi:ABC transporter permease [Treponema phagedenis]|uniref:Efflux ABC transporter, permease protein n=2 Tax=Treponema phagedenis TaxID=162 RepID=A0A0B7GYC3_TREPH|nr:FtsX-like permease family protein [Treponema phagedenis]NVP25388.1 ABC transporter permease [Treponema phagedenis]QKS93609.1 ABC transporter permease [Treponema phagedenis]QLC60248.1 ABC transporter permease [Treponema phagedenis]CEM62607.1 Efflux ABC transporter, permease protein [Treponema phagedenis]
MTRRRMYMRMVISSLVRRRSRMLVALLAIAIGSTVLSGLLTIYYDIPRQMGTVFRTYGANMIFIPSNADEKIQEKQIAEIRSAIPQDKLVGFAPYMYQMAKVHEQPYMIAATDLEGAKNNSPYWLIRGNWPETQKQVLIGNEISKAIELSVGDTFIVNTPKEDGDLTVTECTVSGIVTTGGVEEEFIFMSLEDLKKIIGEKAGFDVIECSIDGNQGYLQNIANKVSQIDSTVTPQLVKRVTESQDTVLNKLQALVWIVTIIVLFLTMICVTTTMMAVVAERRKEIGLKKALGASNKSVVTDFLGEAVMLGIFGGILGVLLGYLFADQVSISVFAREVSFQLPLVPVTLIASVIITIIACLIPVHSTVDIDPAIVLRGE